MAILISMKDKIRKYNKTHLLTHVIDVTDGLNMGRHTWCRVSALQSQMQSKVEKNMNDQ